MTRFEVGDTVVLSDAGRAILHEHPSHTGSVTKTSGGVIMVLWEDGHEEKCLPHEIRLFRGTDDPVTPHQAEAGQAFTTSWSSDPHWPTIYENATDGVIVARLHQIADAVYSAEYPPDDVMVAVLREAAERVDDYGRRVQR